MVVFIRQAIEVGLQVREMMYHKKKLGKIMARLTGQTEEQVINTLSLVNYMILCAWDFTRKGEIGVWNVVACMLDATLLFSAETLSDWSVCFFLNFRRLQVTICELGDGWKIK